MEKERWEIERIEERQILPANWNIKEVQLEIKNRDPIAVDLFIQKMIVASTEMIENI